jgi:hypothetical protein
MQRFVLLAERRSGTTLLVDCLNNLPRVHCEKRAFGIDKRVKDPDENKHSDLLFHYRHRSWRRRLRFYLDRERLIREFLDDEIFTSGLPRDIRGFRLIYDKTVQHPEILSCLRGTDTGIIHLIRQNILKTHLSSVTAPMHRMYHPRAGARIRTVKVFLDPDRLLSDLRERQERIERHRRLVAGFPVLEVIYESFYDRPPRRALHGPGDHASRFRQNRTAQVLRRRRLPPPGLPDVAGLYRVAEGIRAHQVLQTPRPVR